ncbi:TPA: ADP-ribosyltransferase [Photobacterium damselae]
MQQVIDKYDFNQHLEKLGIPLQEKDDLETQFKVALRNYTSRRFVDINSGIRDGNQNPKHIRAVVLLNEALEWCETYPKKYIVRWTNLSDELIEKFRRKGEIIEELGFTSASANPSFKMEGKEYKLLIGHINGKFIGDYSEFPHEEEVLIPAPSYYIVHEFNEEEKYALLEQVDPSSFESEEEEI